MDTGVFIVVAWTNPDGSDAIVVPEEGGGAMTFITHEEAEEFCNTELVCRFVVVQLPE